MLLFPLLVTISNFEIVTDNGNSNINNNAYTASHPDVPTVKYDSNNEIEK